ncbi:hypothetical protein DIPPA_11621 [Diplonema papillatum]|nr:hypothetical protein DIPPA_11621 [Diplonema papillatum]
MGQCLAVEIVQNIVVYLPPASCDAVREVNHRGREVVRAKVSTLDGMKRMWRNIDSSARFPTAIEEFNGLNMAALWNRYCAGFTGGFNQWEVLGSESAVRQWARVKIYCSSWKFPPGHFQVPPEMRLLVWALAQLTDTYTFHYLLLVHPGSLPASTFLLYEATKRPRALPSHGRPHAHSSRASESRRDPDFAGHADPNHDASSQPDEWSTQSGS